ncbi:MAG TPA: ABC transporter permease [Candidatus Limnocylindrales bacterium]|jgi:simple sugar transport system permease protein|nr:ABC transporter permease [Candidatus Limnocylindrales bacterium]
METILGSLYDIPLLGVLFQFLGYTVQVLPRISPIILGLAAPIALGSLCGIMNERSGIVNIGIEGMMLGAAFTGFLAAALVAQAIPAERSDIFGATPALLVGLVVAVATGMLLSALHAWLSISIRADQIISGTIINIAALGLTGYLNRLVITPNPRLGAGTFRSWNPPKELTDLPVVGWVLDMFLDQGPIAMSVIVLVVILQVLLFRSRWGLRTRAVGEHPKAADTVGINVLRLRYRNVIVGGAFAGLAGAYLTLEAISSFQNGMTAGRGFIALAAVIFGRWTPVGAFAGALLFTASDGFGRAVQLRAPSGDFAELGSILSAIPDQFYGALPYLVTIVVLAGVVGRSVPPAAVGQPYETEARA